MSCLFSDCQLRPLVFRGQRLTVALASFFLLSACASAETSIENDPKDASFEAPLSDAHRGPEAAISEASPDALDSSRANCEAGLYLCEESCVDLASDSHNCGVCGQDCQEGACLVGYCQPVLVAKDQPGPSAIATDGQEVYWVNSGRDPMAMAGSVVMCSRQGCGPSPTVIVTGQGLPLSIALDSDSVYWANAGYQGGTISKCARSGCSNTPTILASNQEHPHTIALWDSFVYWSSYGVSGAISRCEKAGCQNRPTLLAQRQPSPEGISVTGARIYWACSDAHEVRACPISGCASDSPQRIAFGDYIPHSVAADSNGVFFSTADSVLACSPGGCESSAQPVAQGQANPSAVTLDSDYVYWVNTVAGGAVLRCPRTGCAQEPEVIAASQDYPSALALDASRIYFTNYGSELSAVSGTVYYVAKPLAR